MRFEMPHAWPTDAAEAEAMQRELRPRLELSVPGPDAPAMVAGCDVAYDEDSDRVAAAVVVLDAQRLTVVDEAVAVGVATFPYIPGLFAFRELPVLLDALTRLDTVPDLFLCDGYGIAHPRRFGLACHLGLITGVPTAGVAKTAFVAGGGQPGPARGDAADLVLDGDVVGRALRTRACVKPVFVSVGNRTNLDSACAAVLACAPRYRLPETTRAADSRCRRALR